MSKQSASSFRLPGAAWLPDVRRRRIALPRRGVEIALLDWGGDGPLALLHHANGFCAGVWGLVAEALRDRFRIVAMDARGHGDSSRPGGRDAYQWDHFAEDLLAVAEILASEGGGRVAVGVGHSFGGTSMLGAAARQPRLFERLVLVDPVIPPPPELADTPERRHRVRHLVLGARRRRQLFPSRQEARQRWARRKLFANWKPSALDLYVAHGLRERDDGQVELKCPAEVEATIFDSGFSFDAFAVARRVVTPTLILWARWGDFPRPTYERLAKSMREAQLEDLEAGHLATMEQPERVAEAVARFASGSRR